MRVNPIGINYPNSSYNVKKCVYYQNNPTFCAKPSSKKFFGGLFGTIATVSAIGGSLILSGGLSLPFIIGYGALGAASGVAIGHVIDKEDKEIKDLDKLA